MECNNVMFSYRHTHTKDEEKTNNLITNLFESMFTLKFLSMPVIYFGNSFRLQATYFICVALGKSNLNVSTILFTLFLVSYLYLYLCVRSLWFKQHLFAIFIYSVDLVSFRVLFCFYFQFMSIYLSQTKKKAIKWDFFQISTKKNENKYAKHWMSFMSLIYIYISLNQGYHRTINREFLVKIKKKK